VVLEETGKALVEGRHARAQIGLQGGRGLRLRVVKLFQQLHGVALGLLGAELEFAGAILEFVGAAFEGTEPVGEVQRGEHGDAGWLGRIGAVGDAVHQLIHAGGEKSVAATKTYTCQLLTLYLLAYALSGDVGLEDLRRVPEWVDAALRLEEDIEDLAERYFFMTRAVTVGRGLNYANALEFGLKLMETCYVVAERFSAADLMHGPIALVERAFPVFVFAPGGVTWPSISAVLDRLRELKAETLIITDESNADARRKAARLIQLPARFKNGIEDLYTPIPYIVPAQLFAAHLASIKGLNADSPRTLTKITRTM